MQKSGFLIIRLILNTSYCLKIPLKLVCKNTIYKKDAVAQLDVSPLVMQATPGSVFISGTVFTANMVLKTLYAHSTIDSRVMRATS